MEIFARIIKHYVKLALERSGVAIDSDTDAELDDAMADLDRHIKWLIRKEIEDHEVRNPGELVFDLDV